MNVMYHYKTEQMFPIDLKRAWTFFSTPENLSMITPPDLGFKILTRLNGEEISKGMKIDYMVTPLLGIRMKWQTEIGDTERLNYFTDIQVKGPYAVWEHKHTFKEVNRCVLMKDEIMYQLPFGFIGRIVHVLFVRRKIESIFRYRRQVLEKLFFTHGEYID